MCNRNHEGYHDPTAAEAIRRADRKHRKHKRLTYLVEESRGFEKAVAEVGGGIR